jgi:hypothetical protein
VGRKSRRRRPLVKKRNCPASGGTDRGMTAHQQGDMRRDQRHTTTLRRHHDDTQTPTPRRRSSRPRAYQRGSLGARQVASSREGAGTHCRPRTLAWPSSHG